MRKPTSCTCELRDLEYLWQSTLVHQHIVFAAEFATMGRFTARMVATCRCRYTSGVNPSSILDGLHVRGAIIEAPYGYVTKCRLAVDTSNVMLCLSRVRAIIDTCRLHVGDPRWAEKSADMKEKTSWAEVLEP